MILNRSRMQSAIMRIISLKSNGTLAELLAEEVNSTGLCSLVFYILKPNIVKEEMESYLLDLITARNKNSEPCTC